MRIQDAINDLAEIRAQIDRVNSVKGFRSAATAASGVATLLGAATQHLFIPEPVQNQKEYLLVWVGVAVISAMIAGVEIAWRSWRNDCHAARQVSWTLVKTIVPFFFVGALLTFCLGYELRWVALFPAIWSLIFGLAIYSCRSLLPKSTIFVAGYYLLAGSLLLLFRDNFEQLSPMQMVATFGVGQFLLASILFANYEGKGVADG